MSAIQISISAEPIFHLGQFVVTNSMFTSVLVTALLIVFAVCANRAVTSTSKNSRFRILVEFIIESLQNLTTGVVGTGKRAHLFGPLIVSFFIFILVNNWAGLIPGVGSIGIWEHHGEENIFVPYFRAGTADLNMTIALALISVVLTQVFGYSFQKLKYFSKFINFSNPLNFFVGVLELVLEVAKIVSFAFRLFGNIFAGEVLLTVMTALVPLIIPMPFYGLELFVGFIQALVFSMLSLVFFNMATIGHGEEH